nr:hypothetical protein [Ferrimicrobium acidiphilum]
MTTTILLHTTHSAKVGSIMAHGFRVSKHTKRGTAYGNDVRAVDEVRLKAYLESEQTLETVRQEMRPDLPSRLYSVFFQFPESLGLFEDSTAFIKREDDHGRPQYDFGCGRDTVFLIDPKRVSIQGAIGDTVLSDEVFRVYWNRVNEFDPVEPEIPIDNARTFWKKARLFNNTESCPDDLEYPEIWYPGIIPPTVILGRYDSHNPLSMNLSLKQN